MKRSDAPAVSTEDLWRELHDGLLAFVRRRLEGEADAEDVVQDIFIRIHSNLEGVRDAAGLYPWVYRIARNAIADHYRERRRVADSLRAAEVAITEGGTPENDETANGVRAELASSLRPLIEALPEPYAEAIELTELRGLTQREAARRLGLSVSGMKSRVQRGRRRLRELLLDCCDFELDPRHRVIGYEARKGAEPCCEDGECGHERCRD